MVCRFAYPSLFMVPSQHAIGLHEKIAKTSIGIERRMLLALRHIQADRLVIRMVHARIHAKQHAFTRRQFAAHRRKRLVSAPARAVQIQTQIGQFFHFDDIDGHAIVGMHSLHRHFGCIACAQTRA